MQLTSVGRNGEKDRRRSLGRWQGTTKEGTGDGQVAGREGARGGGGMGEEKDGERGGIEKSHKLFRCKQTILSRNTQNRGLMLPKMRNNLVFVNKESY